ncbi:MAG: hypothetical protein PHN55_09885, partial [Dysgonamonadaceae bacterium]|nr:hypothetical protein [Dysgonamonadaceae bacterium]
MARMDICASICNFFLAKTQQRKESFPQYLLVCTSLVCICNVPHQHGFFYFAGRIRTMLTPSISSSF